METVITTDLQYDTITDRIMWLGDSGEVAVTTKLSKKDKDNNREYYINEYKYRSNYNNMSYSYTIKRNMNTFINLIYKPDREMNIMITMSELFRLKVIVKEIARFIHEKDNFRLAKDKLIVVNHCYHEIICPGNRGLAFEVITRKDEFNQYEIAVVMYYTKTAYTIMNSANFMMFTEFITTLNLYEAFLMHSNFIASWKEENYSKCLIDFIDKDTKAYVATYENEAAGYRDNTIATQGIHNKKKRLIPKNNSSDINNL